MEYSPKTFQEINAKITFMNLKIVKFNRKFVLLSDISHFTTKFTEIM